MTEMTENRILILDDRAAIAEVIAKIAQSCGYATETTTDAATFLERVDKWMPTHIALDLQMPDVDGIEVLRLLAARQSRARIVIVSGLDGKMVDVARRLGIERQLDLAATVLKPFRRDEIRLLLDRLKVEAWCTPATLQTAIERNEMLLAYQPKIDVASGIVVGHEALVRWMHPQRGLVFPNTFMPLVESCGLIERLTDTVMNLAIAQLEKWCRAYGGRLALNLSNSGLKDIAFPDRLALRCATAGVSPERIELELTESSAMANPAMTMDILSRLRLKGFSLAIDDFGTGFSSLTQLARLPFSEIKIDKSFVLDCATVRESRVIVKSIVDLAHNLNLHAVAEGVEDEITLSVVADLGCDMVQGYHIAKPMAAEAVIGWLDAWRGRIRPVVAAPPEQAAAQPPESAAAVWAKPYDGSEELRAALAQLLYERMNSFWDLGRNSLLGWRLAPGGIEVLMVPYRQIVSHIEQSRRLLQGKRMMGHATFEAARELTGGTPTYIPLPFVISETAADAVPPAVIEQVLRRYGITETLYRAVSLFDIVGFSRIEPSRQIAQLNSLECSINAAQKLMQDIGRRVDLARTTTGDGFYIWSREKGPQSDVDTYLLTLLTIADNEIARRGGGGEFVPELRSCFAIGPHYSYFQIDGLDPRGHDYIVGSVTIGLARMVEKCLPQQILIRDFERPADQANEPTNPIEFIIQAEATFAALAGTMLQGRRIDAVRCYFTGQESRNGRFSISRYTIRDKHGIEHAVFNQKLNIYLTLAQASQAPADRVFIGKRQSDLHEFDAAFAPLELTPAARSIACASRLSFPAMLPGLQRSGEQPQGPAARGQGQL
jgi:EAL domain-containing protein (putative c-di-GMP-specific phosphodiesterase class I)/CheY-like chemotaxis protein